jgi:hypothetical protein
MFEHRKMITGLISHYVLQLLSPMGILYNKHFPIDVCICLSASMNELSKIITELETERITGWRKKNDLFTTKQPKLRLEN